MTAPELKPCPFCGGAATKDHWAQKYMECKSCGVYGPDCIWPDTAENSWNTRADIPAARIAELEAENARLRDETAAAVAAERESCAHICDVETASRLEDGRNAALKIRSLIRARAALDKDRAR